MIEAHLTVQPDAPIGTISPRLYGHFAEHLGRCSYDGLWVGSRNHQIRNYNGFHADVVDALKAMPVPMLRWPGGCYADHYHWRDGIGSERPIRLGMSCGLQVEDDNSLGTHEFIDLCRMLGAEPYLAGNMGSGSVQELCDWMEYCNTHINTNLGKERSTNGSQQPFGVRLWGVGNENWGCGGHYDAISYAREYRRYATMLRHVDPTAELVACGFNQEWNEIFLENNQRHLSMVDHLSIHHYWIHGGPETNFSEEEYYALLAEAHGTEEFVQRTAELIASYSKSEHKIGVALDEWGVWHPEARPFGPLSETHREPITYEQAGTMRDALSAAIALEGFHRQCHVLSLANLAQIVNVIHAPVMTEGARIWLTPTYHVLQMHKPHLSATALPVSVEQSTSIPGGQTPGDTSAVTATASRKGNSSTMTLINRHFNQEATVTLDLADVTQIRNALLLSADAPNSVNSLSDPERVKLRSVQVSKDGNGWRIELPAHSVATIEFS
jgi:alpha-L-arabinofuranosidase